MMINKVYKQRGQRGRATKIIRHKWQYVVSGERIRITSSGDMLIGLADTSPSRKLHIGK